MFQTTLARTLGFLLCIALTAPHPMLMKHICAPFCWPEALGASRVARLNLHKRPLSTSMPRPLPIGYPTKAGACLIRYFPGQFSGLIGTVVNGSALAWWTFFVDSRLDAGLFGQLVQSRTLFELLTSQAERTSAGRRYLKAVHHALEDATAESYVDRRRYIEKLLK